MERAVIDEWIDFHAHILPEVDHGCNSLATAKYQLDEAQRAGIGLVVATSHFYPHQETVGSFLERRTQALNRIKAMHWSTAPKILPAAEVLLCMHMDRMSDVKRLCIEGTNVMLIEMPFEEAWEEEYLRTLDRLAGMGIHIVIAHIERYYMKNVERILERGYDVQVNTDYLISAGRRRVVRKCVESGRVVALGSDIHGTGKSYRLFRLAKEYLERNGCLVMRVCKEILGSKLELK